MAVNVNVHAMIPFFKLVQLADQWSHIAFIFHSLNKILIRLDREGPSYHASVLGLASITGESIELNL